MKLCVFSDIHGNGFAFDAALEKMLSERADFNFFLGDFCGYFFNQKQIFKHLKTIPNLIYLKGNHDHLLLRMADGEKDLVSEYSQKYGRSMEYLLNQDIQEIIEWLRSAQDFYVDKELNCYACHGSPWDNLDGYIYPDTSIKKFADYPQTLFLIGHTHYPMVRKMGNKLIINPGSIGQPRHGGQASYAVIDMGSFTVEFKEIVYDKTTLAKEIEKLDSSNMYLKNIIWRRKNAKTQHINHSS
ncbi:MAG: metallophosphoesterase family protein [Desulfobacula sp.]|jgi:predicted phosphodiesterase|nr:metallophosphoesterase family protein [Desulfobacula sp.]MBT6339487.1 metallophosphoesterase family protein [Desulfobacula sp.]MBT7262058.1 metallophosphoesterase family protein [Desulfobacula sp.]